MSDISGLTQSIAVNSLRSFIEKIERLENEKSCIADDIKEVYNSLKSAGFDAKAAKSIVKLRKQEDQTRKEEEAVLELYKEALGLS